MPEPIRQRLTRAPVTLGRSGETFQPPGATGGPKLFSIDLTGYNERLVATPSFGSDPAWSPLIN